MFYYQAKIDRTSAKYVGSCEMEFKCNHSKKKYHAIITKQILTTLMR